VRPMFSPIVVDGVHLLRNKRVCGDWDKVQAIRKKNQHNALSRWNTGASDAENGIEDDATALRSHATAMPNVISQCKEVSKEVKDAPTPSSMVSFSEGQANSTWDRDSRSRKEPAIDSGPFYEAGTATLPSEIGGTTNALPPSSGVPPPQPKAKAPRAERCTAVQAEELYQIYPRHEAKADGLNAFQKAVEAIAKRDGISITDAHSWMKERVTRYSTRELAKPKEKHEFIPLPATWCNKGRYDDEFVNRNQPTYRDPSELFNGPEYRDNYVPGGAPCGN
jgi:hypothetical protein